MTHIYAQNVLAAVDFAPQQDLASNSRFPSAPSPGGVCSCHAGEYCSTAGTFLNLEHFVVCSSTLYLVGRKVGT